MRLSAKILKNINNVNSFEYSNQTYLYQSKANEFYFQLVDLDRNIRYLTQASVYTLQCTFSSIDDTQILNINATLPFADDKSIWKVSFTSAQLPKSGGFKITLTEDSIVKYFVIQSVINVQLLNIGDC